MRLNLKTIVTLISVAIIGLIIVQMIWINSAIEVRKSQFDQDARNTLIEVTQLIPKVVQQNEQNRQIKSQKKLTSGVTDINALFDAMLDNTPFQKVSDKITSKQIDSLIKAQLQKRGINTSYVFGVYDVNAESLFEQDTATKKYTKQLISEGINLQFFVDNFTLKQPIISIFFPQKNRFIFKKMLFILSISLILILTVIYAFYFTVTTIHKQKQLSEIKNDFINNMTHELKTPISTIQLACEALNDKDMNSPESQQTFVAMINQENTRLSGLVETVLKTAILDKGQMKLKKEEVNLVEIIEQVKSKFSLKIKQLGGDISIASDLADMSFEGDEQHLTNVFQNLIDNAIKYTSEIPQIKISALKTVKDFVIKVNDNGIGISKENLNRVFEKLYRIPTGDLHNVKGFGLGLNYVKSIVELRGGTISVKSTKDKGSTFIISLPIENK